MYDREFEEFLMEQVRRDSALYYGMMITFGCCAAACLVMAIAALIIYGIGSAGICLKMLILIAPFVAACLGTRAAARSGRESADEIAYGLEHPECNIPEDYMDTTKAARRSACRNLHSIWQLIIAYGIIAIMLWGVTVLLAYLAVGMMDLSVMMLFISAVTFAMALGLTILSVAYIRDIPYARKYRQLIESCLNEEAETDH